MTTFFGDLEELPDFILTGRPMMPSEHALIERDLT